jgi:probable F420-dependent oxidoreductase
VVTSLKEAQPQYAVTTGDLDHLTASQAQAYVREVEQAGFGMLWLAEVLGREAFTTAQLALAATSTLMVGSGVARALERVPKNAATAQAGLSEAFPGRYVLGLGVSGAVRERGIGPLPFMTGYLKELDSYPARWEAPAWRVLGAYSRGLTELAAKRADGLLTFLVTSEHTTWARSVLGPEPFLSVAQWVVLSEDRDEVRAMARRQFEYYLKLPHQIAKLRRLGFDDADLEPPGSDRLIDELVSWGSPEDIAASLRKHLDAGADQVAISLLGPPIGKDYRALGSVL